MGLLGAEWCKGPATGEGPSLTVAHRINSNRVREEYEETGPEA